MTIKVELSKGRLCLVDDEDMELTATKWSLSGPGYAARNVGHGRGHRTIVWMHRVILSRMLGRELGPGEEVDHMNHDRLDNRRENLRLSTRSQNAFNQLRMKPGKSGYRGVFPTASGTFFARIRVRGHKIRLGTFTTAEEASRAYRAAAAIHFGQFVPMEDQCASQS